MALQCPCAPAAVRTINVAFAVRRIAVDDDAGDPAPLDAARANFLELLTRMNAAMRCNGAFGGDDARILADGDLDRSERDQMLSRVVALGESSERLRGRWAAALAAVALQDRAAFDRAESRLGGGGDRIVPAPQQLWLSLGDSLLANLFAAMQAEAAQDRSAATKKWGQVAVQARYTGNAVAAKLAEEARLRIE